MEKQRKQRILVFIDWYLPGYKAGGPVRSMANVTAHLAAEFDFYIVTRNTEYGESEPYTTVRADDWNDVQPGVQVWYASQGRVSLTRWRKLIQSVKPDVVYINGIYSPLFSLLPLVAARLLKWPKIIVAPRGMLGQGALDIKPTRKLFYLRLCKILGLYRHIIWHATADTETAEIKKRIASHATVVEAANLPVKQEGHFSSVPIVKDKGVLRLCFISRINRKKNLLQGIEALCALPSDVTVKYDIYGPTDDTAYWEKCLDLMAHLPAHIQVSYQGVVAPSDIRSVFQDHHALLLPTHHENFGHVILECLMAGRPVIISDQTPWRHLADTKAGWDVSIDESTALIRVIEQLAAMDQTTYDQWAQGAWELGRKAIHNEELLDRYRSMFGHDRL
jgi:glycosyltransferase involved in cell wall biosynthesis